MGASFPLDTRQAQLARALLARHEPSSLSDLGSELRLSHRIVRYNLDAVDAFLGGTGLRLVRRRGVGVWIEGDDDARATASRQVDTEHGPTVFDASDRSSRILLALLETAPDSLRSETLEFQLGVSRPTIRRDMRAAEIWLEQHRLHLRRLPGVGVAVRGSEIDVRAGILALLLERVPGEVLVRLAADSYGLSATEKPALADYIEQLDLPGYRRILGTDLIAQTDDSVTMLTATVGLAILVRRIRQGRGARLARGRLRSSLDHPVSETARRIATSVEQHVDMPLGPAETAAITELLLGFVELSEGPSAPDARLVDVVARIMEMASNRLHPSLGEDQLLRTNLTEHMRRLEVRLRYGLPTTNPLLGEVRKRYPDVYAIAKQIVRQIGRMLGSTVPDDEVGFITMYLAGSLERHSLRPKVRVTVVCPAGMATAWILVSRLLAEFPQLEIAQVVSKTVLEHDEERVPTDLIISTIPVDASADVTPSLVVSPLLSERDVRRLAKLLGQPTQH